MFFKPGQLILSVGDLPYHDEQMHLKFNVSQNQTAP